MTEKEKVIYLEADEEITSAIDKLKNLKENQVFLAIPKRANITQSIVNLKILKKQAESLGKEVFIVTQDRIGRILATEVGFTVYQKLSDSKPVEIESPNVRVLPPSEIEYQEEKPAIPKPAFKPEKVVEEKPTEETKKPEKKITLPKVSKKVLFGFLGFILFFILILFFLVLPKATITLYLKSETLKDSFKMVLSKEVSEVDLEKNILPAENIAVEKNEEKSFTTSGKKDIGGQATGTLRIVNANNTNYTWVAGTRVSPTSNSNLIFKLNSAVNIPANNMVDGVAVTAEKPGEIYNLGVNAEFFVVSLGQVSGLKLISLAGTSGGSTKIINILSQDDFNSAKRELSEDLFSQALSDLKGKSEGKIIVSEAIVKNITETSPSIKVGQEGSEFNLKMKVKVWTLSFTKENLDELVLSRFNSLVSSNREILNEKTKIDYNLSKVDKKNEEIILSVKTEGFATAKIDQEQIKKDLSGKSKEGADIYLQNLESVSKFKIDLFPGWPAKLPILKNNIKINIEV